MASQQQISLYTNDGKKKQFAKLDQLAAMVVFGGGRPFTFFEDPFIRALLAELNPSWTPPSADRLTETLLPETYASVREQVQDRFLRPSHRVNVVFDGSNDNALRRQLNISLVPQGMPSIYWRNVDTGSVRHSAEETARIVYEEVMEAFNGNLHKVNSFVTDNAEAALASQRHLKKHPQLQAAFTIGCDSHALQLLLEDILKHTYLADLFTSVSSVVGYFRKAHLQYNRLKDFQRQELNGKTFALLTA